MGCFSNTTSHLAPVLQIETVSSQSDAAQNRPCVIRHDPDCRLFQIPQERRVPLTQMKNHGFRNRRLNRPNHPERTAPRRLVHRIPHEFNGRPHIARSDFPPIMKLHPAAIMKRVAHPIWRLPQFRQIPMQIHLCVASHKPAVDQVRQRNVPKQRKCTGLDSITNTTSVPSHTRLPLHEQSAMIKARHKDH